MGRARSNLAICIATGLALSCSSGCAYRVRPPANLREPVPIIVLDYGIHSSLVLPRGAGDCAEYAYGQWDWFVLDRVAWYRAPATMLLPGKAGLGRRKLKMELSLGAVQAAINAENYYELSVERALARRLVSRLDATIDAAPARTLNARLETEFVPDPQAYSLLHHCNTRVANWLRELGCTVDGIGPDSAFRVDAASTPASPSGRD